ncbi:hypothetical protein BDN71DRAFT_1432562 [Pleurotus eryngii]|uniref:Uncharacterized protein n=1 Tax=Pleurotus eryngii TaxID=5323 RepID=A0A9P5ZV76_PLEER|nr:hypothetical protein BDN71DRAFT_1432562 [Pleurotus eryngii]
MPFQQYQCSLVAGVMKQHHNSHLLMKDQWPPAVAVVLNQAQQGVQEDKVGEQDIKTFAFKLSFIPNHPMRPSSNPSSNTLYWHFLATHKKARSHLGPILCQTVSANSQWSAYTPMGSSESVPVVFIAPIAHVIVRPIPDFPVPGIIHACLAIRLWSCFQSAHLDEHDLSVFWCHDDACGPEELEDSLDDINDLQLPPPQLPSPPSLPPLLFSSITSNASPFISTEQFPLGFAPIKYEDVYPYGVQWREEISGMITNNAKDDETICIRSSDAASAGEAFFLKLLSLLGGDSTDLPVEIELENLMLDNLQCWSWSRANEIILAGAPSASQIYWWSSFSVTSQGIKIAAHILFGSLAVMQAAKLQIYANVLEGLDGSHVLLRRLNWSSLTDSFHDASTAQKVIAAIGMGC